MKATGRVFKYGDNVDTDVIIPARYLNTSDPKELAAHCMEDIDLDFAKEVQEGDIIELGSLKLKIIHTPGHTKGGMCIKVGEHIFTGDTLFAGSIGRTDFYGGDYKQMMKSLRKLAKYDDNAVIYPGHGPTSTIGVEKRMNPYMQQI